MPFWIYTQIFFQKVSYESHWKSNYQNGFEAKEPGIACAARKNNEIEHYTDNKSDSKSNAKAKVIVAEGLVIVIRVQFSNDFGIRDQLKAKGLTKIKLKE